MKISNHTVNIVIRFSTPKRAGIYPLMGSKMRRFKYEGIDTQRKRLRGRR